jgi:hypothetical protein
VEIRLTENLEETFIGLWDSLVCGELDAPDNPSQPPSAWFVIPRDAYQRYQSGPDADGSQGDCAPSHTDGAAPGYSGVHAPTMRPGHATQECTTLRKVVRCASAHCRVRALLSVRQSGVLLQRMKYVR